ncbi:MAG: Rieske (2Fe-2S) protein [Acidimicrobiia bacterium]|nr:Rieske (2Fe-2S) protein [Acidimicrobiia bacterium]
MADLSRRKILGMLAGGFVAFLTSPSAVDAAPTIRAGDTCKKVGRRTTSGGKTFECVETNGARVWKRAKETAKPQQPSGAASGKRLVRAMASSELVAGSLRIVIVTDSKGLKRKVGFARSGGSVVAFDPVCTHLGYELEVRDDEWYCDYHGSRFASTTGTVIEGPAKRALSRYAAIERSGAIYLSI